MKISSSIILCVFFFCFISCKKESLQSYLIESQEKKEFKSFSFSSSLLQLASNKISLENQEDLKGIQKINITGLLAKDAAEGQYEIEKQKLKKIFKNSDYKTLINFKKDDYNATLYYIGSTDAIDEIIIFGYGEELGIGIARVLGDHINPNAIIKMLKSTELNKNNIKLDQFKSFLGEFK